MRITRGVLCLVLPLAGCAPSRASLFDPVRATVSQRIGVAPTWGRRPEGRVRELLAAPLTADSAALVAALNNPALQAAYEDLAGAGAALAMASTPRNPELEAELRFPLESGGHTQVELAAVQDLTSLLAIAPARRAAGADLAAARREAAAATIDAAAQARVALYRAAAAGARLALRRSLAEAATASAELARRLYDAGNITELASLREALVEEEAAVALRGAEADEAVARAELGTALGVEGGEWRIAEGLLDAAATPAALDGLEADAEARSLDLEAARLRLEAAGGRAGVARLESFVPHLGAGASAVREGDAGWHVGPAVSLSLPLFDVGQGKRAAASSDIRRRQQQLAALTLEVRAGVRAARERLLAAEEQLARIRDKLLPLRDRLLAESLRQANAMSLGTFELLLARREQIAIDERHLQAREEVWIARTAVWQLRAGGRPAPHEPRPSTPFTSDAPRGGH